MRARFLLIIISTIGVIFARPVVANSTQFRDTIKCSGEFESRFCAAADTGLKIAKSIQVDMTKNSLDILSLLEVIGVGVRHLDGKCPKGIPESVIAAYNRFDNYILICHGSVLNREHLEEAITHESVHAIQDCIQPGGIKGNKSIAISSYLLAINLVESNERFISLLRQLLWPRNKTVEYLYELKTKLNSDFFLMEYEAYALEIRPAKVATLVEKIAIPKCSLTP
jgi:hypothetical protein